MPSMRDKILLTIAALALVALVAEFAKGQTKLGPQQVSAPRVAVMTCTKTPTAPVTVTNPDGTITTTPGSDCAGLYYVDVITPAGTELKILGTVQPAPVNAADWSLVP